MYKTLLFSLMLYLFPKIILAQEVEMADGLHQSGKIYVVVVVLSIIIVGLFGYLFYLDKKITGHEKRAESK